MNDEQLIATVREACATELERLGKEKALIATTQASLNRIDVLQAAAMAEARAQTTFELWATTESNTSAREAFETAAVTEADHRTQISDLLDEPIEEPDMDPLHRYLAELESTPERVGAGLVGRPMAAERTLLQVVNFFLNEADSTTTDEFRAIRGETQAMITTGASLLETICDDAADWVVAQQAAESAIGTVYDDYAETLSGMGLDPKPVC
jgi:hypothetical protein